MSGRVQRVPARLSMSVRHMVDAVARCEAELRRVHDLGVELGYVPASVDAAAFDACRSVGRLHGQLAGLLVGVGVAEGSAADGDG